ncbi:hypothetical protein U0026_09870 [Kluyvera intermedia]|uniref:hypothetical protein n=1 Tax=Kluyvera intermedia TaxID=61648 RepID=UPI000787C324|nr:hypothetical protein [Kluyvera intermedia]WQD31502.1 hypothetical protein U0026_09870 [Kluyvera intermedia]VDZ82834.1 Uncharacterised protein [Kluyvera intermedia]
MVETQVKYVVVGHHSRIDHALCLAMRLDAHLLIDYGNHGANWNHRRALEWAAEQTCRVVVLEDDALPVRGFRDKLTGWLARFPDSLISFYLGTGRPPQYQMQIATKLIDADKRQVDYININRLIHGVCYSVPQSKLQQVITRWNTDLPADYAVGDACGGDVVYPCYSLADHADVATVERHPDNTPRTERRKAWRLDA